MTFCTVHAMARKKEISVSVRMDPDILAQIERKAANYNTSRAAVIRQLLEEGMKAHVKLLPSATSLEKEMVSLNKKIDKIAEAIRDQYGIDPPNNQGKTHTAD